MHIIIRKILAVKRHCLGGGCLPLFLNSWPFQKLSAGIEINIYLWFALEVLRYCMGENQEYICALFTSSQHLLNSSYYDYFGVLASVLSTITSESSKMPSLTLGMFRAVARGL